MTFLFISVLEDESVALSVEHLLEAFLHFCIVQSNSNDKI